MNQFLDVSNEMDNIDTFDSCTQNFYILNKQLIMPFVNLYLIDNVIENNQRVKVEFAYLILKDVSCIQWIGQNENRKDVVGELVLGLEKKVLTDWFAFNLHKYGYELKVNFDEIELFIPKVARIGSNQWSLWDTPNFKKNIEQEKANAFFELEMLPKMQVLEGSKMTPMSFTESDEKRKIAIQSNWSKEW